MFDCHRSWRFWVFCVILSDISSRLDAVTFNCKYKIENFIQNSFYDVLVENAYTCNVHISGRCDSIPEWVVGVSTNHLPGKTDRDVDVLVIKQLNETKLAQNIFKFFTHLKILVIFGGNLMEITSDDLKFHDLKAIFIENTNLRVIDGNLFRHATRLEVVAFSWNKISNIGENLLEPLLSIRYVHFNDNLCTNNSTIFDINSLHRENARIIELKEKLLINCPPTLEMIQRVKVQDKILRSEEITLGEVFKNGSCSKDYNFIVPPNKIKHAVTTKIPDSNTFLGIDWGSLAIWG